MDSVAAAATQIAPVAAATQIHIDGLLHLGALAIAITAAYVGLDRIKIEPDDFSTGLDKVREDVRSYISKHFDIKCDEVVFINKSTRMTAVLVLCYIANAKTRTRIWAWPIHFVLRHIHVPFYRYFSGRHDIRFMALSCLFSLISFVYLVSLQVFDYDLAQGTQMTFYGYPFNFVRLVFVIYTLIIFFAFASVSVSSRLKLSFLSKKCARLFKQAYDQRAKVATAALQEAMQYGPKFVDDDEKPK
ncbi:MAG: hypothetical protein QOJ15_1948 [Bradyrhizobium sp.]|jgi:hypothetical protein|nr:hypothetical protein [Bradyrhizobium sp.]